MATNLQIDDKLIQTAVKLGGHRTKKEAVTQALVEYNQHLQQIKVLNLFGTIEYEKDYNYKDQRSEK
jgi:Arc/MetJ family transcription regulator